MSNGFVNNGPVLFERLEERVALVTLNRPQARNAVNGEVTKALSEIVERTEAENDIWAVVLTGAGEDAFCAGADLKEIANGRSAALVTEKAGFGGFVYADRAKPWIAAVKGRALAGGCEIALACDMIVAAEGAVFGLPEVARGLIAAAGGLFRLPRVLPRNLAVELIATGGELTAERAHALGFVNRIAPKDRLLHEAAALARLVVRNAPIAVSKSLSIAKQSADLAEIELRKRSDHAIQEIFATADAVEGPRAFIEKRAAQWSGS
jgi:enoyl-CoA hydratase/carnithine racemase